MNQKNKAKALEIVNYQIKAFEGYGCSTAIVSTQGIIREMKRLKALLESE